MWLWKWYKCCRRLLRRMGDRYGDITLGWPNMKICGQLETVWLAGLEPSASVKAEKQAGILINKCNLSVFIYGLMLFNVHTMMRVWTRGWLIVYCWCPSAGSAVCKKTERNWNLKVFPMQKAVSIVNTMKIISFCVMKILLNMWRSESYSEANVHGICLSYYNIP
jgi:hypothetical protein